MRGPEPSQLDEDQDNYFDDQIATDNNDIDDSGEEDTQQLETEQDSYANYNDERKREGNGQQRRRQQRFDEEEDDDFYKEESQRNPSASDLGHKERHSGRMGAERDFSVTLSNGEKIANYLEMVPLASTYFNLPNRILKIEAFTEAVLTTLRITYAL